MEGGQLVIMPAGCLLLQGRLGPDLGADQGQPGGLRVPSGPEMPDFGFTERTVSVHAHVLPLCNEKFFHR